MSPADGSLVAPATILVPLDELLDSPYQPPGRSERGIDELSASMSAPDANGKPRGQTTPMIVRLLGDGTHRIVGGHRRKRALARLGILLALIIVREMTDDEERELALVDNVQRTDLEPLEEADELGRMRDELTRSPEQIASRVGKSTAHVYRRLSLLRLTPEARKALEEGRIMVGVAEQLATVSDGDAQAKALEDILRYVDITIAQAKRIVRDRFHLRLAEAGFPLDDAQLVPSAGSCLVCPKRTSAQLLLLEEAEEDERCTASSCFSSKRAAFAERAKKEAVAKGVRVIEGQEAAKLFPYGDRLSYQHQDLVDLDDRFPHDPAPPRAPRSPAPARDTDDEDRADEEDLEEQPARTWKEALGEHAKPVACVVTSTGKVHYLAERKDVACVVTSTGKVHYLAERKDVARGMRAVGFEAEAKDEEAQASEAEKAGGKKPSGPTPWEVERKARDLFATAAVEAIVAKAERAKALGDKTLRHLVALLVRTAPEDRLEEVCRRRELLTDAEIAKNWTHEIGWKALGDVAARAELGELYGLAIEIILTSDEYFPPEGKQEMALHLAARAASVDLDALKKEALKAAKAQLSAAKKGKEKKPAKGKTGALEQPSQKPAGSGGGKAKTAEKPARSRGSKSPLTEREEAALEQEAKQLAIPVRERVWEACEGGKTIAKIVTATGLSLEEVQRHLDSLFGASRISKRHAGTKKETFTRVGLGPKKPLEHVSSGDLEQTIVCPRCNAEVGAPCQKSDGGYHARRSKLAIDQRDASKPPLSDKEQSRLADETFGPMPPKAPAGNEPPAFGVGSRVRIAKGPHAGRAGVISKLCKPPFGDRAYVLLDKAPREKKAKSEQLGLADLEPAPEVLGSAVDERYPSCRVCGCTAAKPCDSGAGRSCSESSEADLCSVCDQIGEAFVELLEGGAVETVLESTELDGVSKPRVQKALDDRILSGRLPKIERLPKGRIAMQLERPIDQAKLDAELDTDVRVELGVGPGTEIGLADVLKHPVLDVCASLARLKERDEVTSFSKGGKVFWTLQTMVTPRPTAAAIDAEVLTELSRSPGTEAYLARTLGRAEEQISASVERLYEAGSIRSMQDNGLDVWRIETKDDDAAAPKKAGRGRPKGSKNKPKAAK